MASSAGGTTGGGAAGQHFDAIHLRLLRRSIADLVGVGDRFRLALRTSLIFSGIIFLSLAITVGGDARFLWRTMGTRPGCDTWVLGWVLGSALGLLISGARGSEAPSSWGSHAHPLVSCFSSLVLFVSLFVISLVVISWESLSTVQRRCSMAGTACG